MQKGTQPSKPAEISTERMTVLQNRGGLNGKNDSLGVARKLFLSLHRLVLSGLHTQVCQLSPWSTHTGLSALLLVCTHMPITPPPGQHTQVCYLSPWSTHTGLLPLALVNTHRSVTSPPGQHTQVCYLSWSTHTGLLAPLLVNTCLLAPLLVNTYRSVSSSPGQHTQVC